MSRNHSDLEELCDSLYSALVTHECVPQLEVEQIGHDSKVHIDVIDQPSKRFFPLGTAEKVFHLDTLQQLFELVIASEPSPHIRVATTVLVDNVVERKLLEFLATLIYSRCRTKDLQSFTRELVAVSVWGRSDESWSKLPVKNDERLRRTLGNEVITNSFVNNQDLFCAAVLEKNQEIKHDFRRLPYMKERLIGQGSFGRIFKVTIAPQHLKDRQQLSNPDAKEIVRKDFELNAHDNAHEKERDVLREIVRNAKTHKNIMKNWGSLQIGSTYSLFMPVADCDLQQYMERNPQPPKDWAQKAKLLQCAVGLSGAVEFLHTSLESENYEKLSCFHMDLKPQNILVVTDNETGEVQWKLSDFNMSRVKTRRKPTDERLKLRQTRTFGGDVHDFNKLFNRRTPEFNHSSLTEPTINRRGTGTYLAPEACIEGESVLAESDTWSLGCVISVVFTYLHGGAKAVDDFSTLRSGQGLDRFFTFTTASEPRKLRDVVLNDAVRKWFSELRRKTMQNHQGEGLIFENMMRFLENNVLVVNPSIRRSTTAANVREKLIAAFREYGALGHGNVSPKRTNFFDSITKFVGISKRGQLEPEGNAQEWAIPLSSAVKACEFGPKAQLLVCVTDTEITGYSLDHICLTNNFGDLIECGSMTPEPKQRKWLSTVGVSRNYVVAATDYNEFDCYIYHISQPDSHTSKLELYNHIELTLPAISRIAISPDGNLVAFILYNSIDCDREGSLYVAPRKLLSKRNTRFSSTSSSPSQSSTTMNSTLGRPIPLPVPAEDIRELKFSLINTLYAVVKPKQTGTMRENALTILAWTVRDGKRQALTPSKILHDGKDDLLQGLFTSFAPFNLGSAYVVVSQEKRVVTRSWETQRSLQTKAKGYRLTKVLLDYDDRTVISFGIREANNDLRLLTFPVPTSNRDLKIDEVVKLPKMSPHNKFAASIYSSASNAKLHVNVWIADINGHSVRIIPISYGDCEASG